MRIALALVAVLLAQAAHASGPRATPPLVAAEVTAQGGAPRPGASSPAEEAPRSATSTAAADGLPALEQVTLDNGLRVIAFARRDQPVVLVRLVIPAARLHEPAGKAGLAKLTAAALTGGAGDRSAAEISDWLDARGARLGAFLGVDDTFVEAAGLSRDLDPLLALVADCTLRPTFPEAEIVRARAFLQAELRRPIELGDLAEAHLDSMLFGPAHPFGRVDTATTLESLDRAAVAAFHATTFRPNGAALVIAGDLDPKATLARVRALFSPWAQKGGAVPTEAPSLTRPRIRAIHQPGTTRAELRIAFHLPPLAAADRPAAELMVRALALDAFTPFRLNEPGKEVRVETSLVDRVGGARLDLALETRATDAAENLKKVLGQLQGFVRNGPSEDATERATKRLLAELDVSRSDTAQLADRIAFAEAGHGGVEGLRALSRDAPGVTRSVVAALAQRTLRTAFALAIAGDAKTLAEPLRAALAGIPIEQRKPSEIGEPEPPTLAANAPEKAKALFAQAITAVGGREALNLALAGVTLDGMLVAGPGPMAKRSRLILSLLGDHTQRMDVAPGENRQTVVLTPTTAFATASNQLRDLPKEAATIQRMGLLLNFPALLTLADRPDFEVVYLRDEEAPGDPGKVLVSVVEVRRRLQPNGPAFPFAQIFFDTRTSVPYGHRQLSADHVREVHFGRYRREGPILFPMQQDSLLDGLSAGQMLFGSISFGPPAPGLLVHP